MRTKGRKTPVVPSWETTFGHAVFLRKLHTYAVNVSTGSEEDPGRTRSAGYQVVCIAWTLLKSEEAPMDLFTLLKK